MRKRLPVMQGPIIVFLYAWLDIMTYLLITQVFSFFKSLQINISQTISSIGSTSANLFFTGLIFSVILIIPSLLTGWILVFIKKHADPIQLNIIMPLLGALLFMLSAPIILAAFFGIEICLAVWVVHIPIDNVQSLLTNREDWLSLLGTWGHDMFFYLLLLLILLTGILAGQDILGHNYALRLYRFLASLGTFHPSEER
jgi:hypothetical protein